MAHLGVRADAVQVIPDDSLDISERKENGVTCLPSEHNNGGSATGHLVEPSEQSSSNKTVNTNDDQTRATQPDISPIEAETQYDISTDLKLYTSDDLKNALSEIHEEVARYYSPPDQRMTRSLSNTILATAGSSLLNMLEVNKRQEGAKKPEDEGKSNTCPVDDGGRDTDPQGSSTIPSPEGQSGVSNEETVSPEKFMGELVSPRDTDINDLSDHEIVSKSDVMTEIENGLKSPETETNPSSPGRKTVRFLLDEKDSPSNGLTKKVSGVFSSSSSSLSISSSSSTSDFAVELPSCVEPIIEEVSDSSGPCEGGGIDHSDEIWELPSPRIYFTEKELPLINCPNQEHVFELEDIIPKEISASASPLATPDTSFENSPGRVSPDEYLFAPIKPFVEIPVCDNGCARYFSEVTLKAEGEDGIQTGANAEDTASSQQLRQLKDLPAPFAMIDPDPDDVGCFNRSLIHDPESEMDSFGNNISFPDEVVLEIEGLPGSFTANDLPMTIPTAFKHFHSGSDHSLSEGGRCSSGSMDVMPSESNESLTITTTETGSTALERPDTNNLIGVTSPIVLKRSLYYLSQIHQLEKMVQDGQRHVQSLKEDSVKREQEYEEELLALRQSLQRELEESRTQGWLVEKRLTGQVKCLTADNAALMRQVNHTTNRMQESERINTMMVAQYHNALSTVQAMEKEYYSAQKKIKELNGKLETEKQSDSGEKQPDSAVKGNVEEGLLKEKQELLQCIQKLEDRLVGQKDINSRLLSEIEKTREEKKKEAERINEEKEREFKIKTGIVADIFRFDSILMS
eukprot:XP_011677176.1 PREDICTED: uncharacterized protein LOC105444536 [Strongylocentrotus purpuratus]